MLWRAPIERPTDGFRFHLAREERALLERLAVELESALDGSDDPALGRLFPDAYEDDDAAAADYRELVGRDLREERRAAARVLRETLGRGTLSENEVDAWLRALNDLRLVLGTRLGVTEELYEHELDPADPRAPELAVFFYLTWLQERMIQAVDRRV
ncbi:MAG: DUF2017 domain-containing protein [Actinobacteria bacterium]|nr:DUF2017 domain-containing protein [Actinomycetota bacterium]